MSSFFYTLGNVLFRCLRFFTSWLSSCVFGHGMSSFFTPACGTRHAQISSWASLKWEQPNASVLQASSLYTLFRQSLNCRSHSLKTEPHIPKQMSCALQHSCTLSVTKKSTSALEKSEMSSEPHPLGPIDLQCLIAVMFWPAGHKSSQSPKTRQNFQFLS